MWLLFVRVSDQLPAQGFVNGLKAAFRTWENGEEYAGTQHCDKIPRVR